MSFTGKCIHGKEGARFYDGYLKSRQCPVCYPELAHTCPYAEEILGDSTSLCTCGKEQVGECQNEI